MRKPFLLTAVVGTPLLVLGLLGLAVPISAQAAAAPAVPATFDFSGSGWGHGVGMSQYGALGMATEGASATTILTHYYTGTTIAAYGDSQDIAVSLAHRVTGVKFRTEALQTDGGDVAINLGSSMLYGTAGDEFGLSLSGSKIVVTKNGVKRGSGTNIVVRWSGTRNPSKTLNMTRASVLNLVSPTSSFATSGHRYRYGFVRVVARTVGGVTRLEVVNTLRLHDEYLRGIAEVSSSWPAAALQAQVIAARSYALVKYEQGLKAGCQCHVDAGRGPFYDQNFVGYVKESSSFGSAWRAAVTATAVSSTTSKTVLYKGKPAQAFYSSSSGGRTQNVKDVWGTAIPYLVSVDDHWATEAKYNPNATWGPYSRSQAKVAAAFGLADVDRLDLSKRYASGALQSATAWSSKGTSATISVGAFVSRLALTSNWVTRAATTYPGDATTAAVSIGRTTANAARTVVIAPSANVAVSYALIAAPLARSKGAPLLLTPAAGLSSAVAADLKRRGATKAYLVGGSAVLSKGVTHDLVALGVVPMRLAGANAADVSVEVAKAMGTAHASPVFAASAEDPSATLVAAAPAASLKRPLLLVGSSAVAPAVRSYLKALAPISTVLVGGVNSASASVLKALPNSSRVGGADSASTSVLVAHRYRAALSARSVVLSTTPGVTFARATATLCQPVLITGTLLTTTIRRYLQETPTVTRVVTVAGAVSSSTVTAARRA